MRERPQIRIDVLAVGYLVRDGREITEAHSTSVLIRTDEVNIVVDTSTKYMLPAVKTSFKQLGILPKDVNMAVLTHTHHDHCGNNDLFKKAEFYVREEECPGKKGYTSVSRDLEIASGIRLVHTPGHTEGSMSVLIDSDRKYAVAGDAIPLEDNFLKMMPPGISCDKEKAMKSIKSIIEYADVIIPGHGLPFLKDGVL